MNNLKKLYPRVIAESKEWLNKRNKARQARRVDRTLANPITFDCFNCHYLDGRAVCVKGHNLYTAEDGSMELRAVLRGFTASVCKTCSDFVTEDNPYEY